MEFHSLLGASVQSHAMPSQSLHTSQNITYQDYLRQMYMHRMELLNSVSGANAQPPISVNPQSFVPMVVRPQQAESVQIVFTSVNTNVSNFQNLATNFVSQNRTQHQNSNYGGNVGLHTQLQFTEWLTPGHSLVYLGLGHLNISV